MNKKLSLGSLAWPIFVENILSRAMGMVNIYLLSMFNEEAVAAVGVTNQMVNFISMLFYFVSLGTAVLVSQNLGAGNRQRAAETSAMALIINGALGVAMGGVVVLLHRSILSAMGLRGTVLDYAGVYFRLIGGLCALQGFTFTMATILRNYGQPRLPMIIFLGMNALNLVGNAWIVTHPLGSVGESIAAIATCTMSSQAIAAAVMALCARRLRLGLRVRNPLLILRDIFRVGIPGAGDAMAYTVAQLSLTSFVTPLGTTAVAALTYAQNFIGMVQLPGFAVGQSAQILTGRHVGAGEANQAYKLAFCGTWIAMGLNVLAISLVLLLHRPLLGLYTANRAVVSIVFLCLLIDLAIECGRPFNLVIGSSLRGAGDVKWAIAASVSSVLLVCIPLGYVFTHWMALGVPGVFLALCADEWIRGQLMTWRWRTRIWERAKLVHAESAQV